MDSPESESCAGVDIARQGVGRGKAANPTKSSTRAFWLLHLRRASAVPPAAMAASTSSPTLILDNGAHSIKALWADSSLPPQCAFLLASRRAELTHLQRTFRNAITKSKTEKRSYIADELEECADYGGLVFRLPFERVSSGSRAERDWS